MMIITPDCRYDPLKAEPDFILSAVRLKALPPAKSIENFSYTYGRDSFLGRNPEQGKNFFIKKAGSDKHYSPKGLEDIIQSAANHQYEVSPYAREKICIASIKSTLLEPQAELSGGEIHARGFSGVERKKFDAALSVYFAIAAGTGRIMSGLSAFQASERCSVHEYAIASIEPEFYLARPENVPFTPSERCLELDDELARQCQNSFGRASEGDLVFLNSSPFRAPRQDEISPDNYGKSRIHISLLYLTNRTTEALLPL